MKHIVAILQKAFLILFVIFSFHLTSNAIGINGLAVNTPKHTITSNSPFKNSENGQKSVNNNNATTESVFIAEKSPLSELSKAVNEEVSTENTVDAFMAFGLVTFFQVILILLSPVIVPRLIKAVKL